MGVAADRIRVSQAPFWQNLLGAEWVGPGQRQELPSARIPPGGDSAGGRRGKPQPFGLIFRRRNRSAELVQLRFKTFNRWYLRMIRLLYGARMHRASGLFGGALIISGPPSFLLFRSNLPPLN